MGPNQEPSMTTRVLEMTRGVVLGKELFEAFFNLAWVRSVVAVLRYDWLARFHLPMLRAVCLRDTY